METPTNFSVIHRNFGHWDIATSKEGRIFRIRGGPGRYWVADERETNTRQETKYFNTVGLCMAYICDILTYEQIVAKGQTPIEIESWNV